MHLREGGGGALRVVAPLHPTQDTNPLRPHACKDFDIFPDSLYHV